MRDLNYAYVLPNPPLWKARARRRITKATTGLRNMFVTPQQGVTRVSMYHSFRHTQKLH